MEMLFFLGGSIGLMGTVLRSWPSGRRQVSEEWIGGHSIFRFGALQYWLRQSYGVALQRLCSAFSGIYADSC